MTSSSTKKPKKTGGTQAEQKRNEAKLTQKNSAPSPQKLTLADRLERLAPHFVELRNRLLIWAGLTAMVAAIIWWQKQVVLEFLTAPLQSRLPLGQSLIATGLPELFFVHLKLSVIGALVFSFPFLLLQLWRFVLPGLYQHERRWAWLVLGLAPILFYSGIVLFWELVWPVVLPFFLGFTSADLMLLPSVSQYLNFLMRLGFGFGLAFQLPVVLIVTAKIGLTPPWQLRKWRRWWILLAFVLAAVLTPPDPASQLLLACPLLLLYEVGIWLAVLFSRPKSR